MLSRTEKLVLVGLGVWLFGGMALVIVGLML